MLLTEDPEDFVRLEIKTALEHGPTIIPTLLAGSSMPTAEQLPEDIKEITRFQAIDIRKRGEKDDLRGLIDAVALALKHSTEQKGPTSPPRSAGDRARKKQLQKRRK